MGTLFYVSTALCTEQDVLPSGTRSADEYKRLAAEAFQKAEEALQRVDARQGSRPRMPLLIGRGESTINLIWMLADCSSSDDGPDEPGVSRC